MLSFSNMQQQGEAKTRLFYLSTRASSTSWKVNSSGGIKNGEENKSLNYAASLERNVEILYLAKKAYYWVISTEVLASGWCCYHWFVILNVGSEAKQSLFACTHTHFLYLHCEVLWDVAARQANYAVRYLLVLLLLLKMTSFPFWQVLDGWPAVQQFFSWSLCSSSENGLSLPGV